MKIVLDGKSLTPYHVRDIARGDVHVEVSDSAMHDVKRAREYVEEIVKNNEIVYGITTGFGKFSDTLIPADDVAELQHNLIISHSCGMGNPLPSDVSRAAMLLRCNNLVKGHSGVRPVVVETLLNMLNKRVHPVIPEQGSLGASGDLAPLSHIVLVMMGEGEAEYQGNIIPGGEAMKKAGIAPLRLGAKEGLALINGTQIMTAIGCLCLCDAIDLAKTADISAALSCEAMNAITKAYDPKVHAVRGQKGQIDTAANMLAILAGSKNCLDKQPNKVQDAYSLRCIPQVHGAGRDALRYAYDMVTKEINAVTDNPIIFPQEREVISGGNFHGQPMALTFDFMKIAIAEYADIAERRIERLVNPALSGGLPAFLAKNGGLNSGFMILQYSAASIVSESKVYAHPASVDSIPSSANQEDHVSMGTTAARTAEMILRNSRKVIAMELFAAAQALGFKDESALAPATKAVYSKIREYVPFLENDVIMYVYMNALESMVKNGEILHAAQGVCGELK